MLNRFPVTLIVRFLYVIVRRIIHQTIHGPRCRSVTANSSPVQRLSGSSTFHIYAVKSSVFCDPLIGIASWYLQNRIDRCSLLSSSLFVFDFFLLVILSASSSRFLLDTIIGSTTTTNTREIHQSIAFVVFFPSIRRVVRRTISLLCPFRLGIGTQ